MPQLCPNYAPTMSQLCPNYVSADYWHAYFILNINDGKEFKKYSCMYEYFFRFLMLPIQINIKHWCNEWCANIVLCNFWCVYGQTATVIKFFNQYQSAFWNQELMIFVVKNVFICSKYIKQFYDGLSETSKISLDIFKAIKIFGLIFRYLSNHL